MPGTLGDIPGMYYDESKRKYFTIQAAGASPSSSAYSGPDVKRRKLEDELVQITEKEKRQRGGRIRRSIQDPLIGGILRREYGHSSMLDLPQIYASKLVYRGRYPAYSRRHEYNCLFTVRMGEFSGTLSTKRGPRLEIHTMNDCKLSRGAWYPESRFRVCRPLDTGITRTHCFPFIGHSSSMSLHEGQKKLLVTWMSGNPNTGIGIVSTDEELSSDTPAILLGPGITRGPEVDVLSSTAAPTGSPYCFLTGTSDGIMSVDSLTLSGSFLSRRLFSEGQGKDILALDFLSNDSNVILSGGRSGILNITDMRVQRNQSDYIRHPGSVIHIKQLDTHRVIVAGLKSNLCQYDLRYRKGIFKTLPILKYPEYQNEATIQIGFDVDIEAGIVAAAQEHDLIHPPVQLFSLHGGNKLCSVRRKSPLDDIKLKENRTVSCLRFLKDSENKPKALYISVNKIRRYMVSHKELNAESSNSGASTRPTRPTRPGSDSDYFKPDPKSAGSDSESDDGFNLPGSVPDTSDSDLPAWRSPRRRARTRGLWT